MLLGIGFGLVCGAINYYILKGKGYTEGLGLYFFIGFCLGLLGVLLALVKPESPNKQSDAINNNKNDNIAIVKSAFMQYQRRVKEYEQNGILLSESDKAALFAQCIELQVLKTPSSAVFPPLNEMRVSGSDGRYTVSGYVDSQNSYGAMIRTNYTYNVHYSSLIGEWTCQDQL
jgi:hypothetical protein